MTIARPFDAVIFDLDGTLVDSVPDIASALNTTLTEAGLPTLPIDAIVACVGDGAAKLIERAIPASEAGRDLAPLIARFIAHYATHPCVDSRLYPGVADLLQQLSRVGLHLVVLTNKPSPVTRALLGALGIADKFAIVIADGDGFPRKPDPAGALAIIRQLGTSAARTIVVGDGLPDIRMARALPCPVAAVGWGYVPPDILRSEKPTFFANTARDLARILLPEAPPTPAR